MSIRKRFGRPDWLAEMQGLLVLGVLALGLALIGTAVTVVAGAVRTEVPVAATEIPATATGGLSAGSHVDPDGVVTVRTAHPDLAQRIASGLARLPTLIVATAALALLLATIRRARLAEPFSATVVRRLRWLGVVLLGGGSAAEIVETIARLDLSLRATGDHASTVLQLGNFAMWLLLAFGVFAVAELVNRGRHMREELDTVI